MRKRIIYQNTNGYFNLNRYLGLIIAVFIAIGNVILDHFYAPQGIDYTPAVIIAVAILINFNKQKFNIYLQTVLTFVLVALNDAGIKLYGGGMHDNEGLGFIMLFLFAGLIPGFIIIVIGVCQTKNISVVSKIVSISLFLLLLCLYLHFFESLGLGKYYPIDN